MSKKFWLYLSGILIFLVLLFVVLRNFSGLSGSSETISSKLPDYVLSADQEQQVRGFVQNFVNLYNTYSADDRSNLTALGDYETEAMQQQTVQIVQNQQIPAGYSVQSIADAGSFGYTYSQAAQLQAHINGTAKEITGASGKSGSYNFTANLTLVRNGMNWLVDTIELTKN